ncbi:hypothetical protein ACFPN2_29710 [Steroidobacter flavus]|uniref:SGNH hydrolase-type esterase domain-containing protein n=1 Tax=Steroidobacter flavus TaxID=1842136 RepID=A0ABV8T2C0_9GAMM
MTSRLGALLRATETRVVFALLAAIALVDIGLRLMESRLSGNLAHIAAIPEIIEAAGKPQRHSLLLLGNSLTHNGVSASVVGGRLPNVSVAKVTPDGTGLWDWQCLLDHQVIERREVQFDTVVIGFAWHLLSDQARHDPSRLGGLYCRMSDLANPRTIGLETGSDIGEFVAAAVLRTYALRDTLRNRFFQLVVPSYETFTQAGNAARAGVGAQPGDAPHEAGAPEVVHTYRTFAELVDRLKSKGTQVIVVAMPVQSDYEIDPALRELETSRGLSVIDLRKVAGLDSSHYLDEMHLNHAGQQILSKVLAADLHAELASAT